MYGLDPLGVSNDDPDIPLLQNVKDGDPVLPSGLHADIQAGVFMEPVGKAVQIRVECGKAFLLITWLQAICWGLNDGSHQK